MKLNKNLEVLDFQKIEVKTFFNNVKNNDFLINKSDKIIVKGNVFDAEPLLKSLYKKTDRKKFSKYFNFYWLHRFSDRSFRKRYKGISYL